MGQTPHLSTRENVFRQAELPMVENVGLEPLPLLPKQVCYQIHHILDSRGVGIPGGCCSFTAMLGNCWTNITVLHRSRRCWVHTLQRPYHYIVRWLHSLWVPYTIIYTGFPHNQRRSLTTVCYSSMEDSGNPCKSCFALRLTKLSQTFGLATNHLHIVCLSKLSAVFHPPVKSVALFRQSQFTL